MFKKSDAYKEKQIEKIAMVSIPDNFISQKLNEKGRVTYTIRSVGVGIDFSTGSPYGSHLRIFEHRFPVIDAVLAVEKEKNDGEVSAITLNHLFQSVRQMAKVVVMAKKEGNEIKYFYVNLFSAEGRRIPGGLFSITQYINKEAKSLFCVKENQCFWSWRSESYSKIKNGFQSEKILVALTDDSHQIVAGYSTNGLIIGNEIKPA